MPLNNIKFNVLQGGLGRVIPGEDHISALAFAIAAPASFGTDKMRAYQDIESVIADGMTADDANFGKVYYHAKEFFRINNGAKLWIGFNLALATDLLVLAAGKVRQLGLFFTDFADLTAVHEAAATALDSSFAPLVILAGYEGVALDLAAVADMGTLTAPNVSVLLAGDGGAAGATLATDLGQPYVPAVGAVLGAMSKANVHESIAWVQEFNLSDSLELDIIRLADGIDNPSESTLNDLNDKRYLVFRKHIGIAGTYLNDSHSAIAVTSDLAYIENNRTLQKAKRLIRIRLLPQLNSPISVDGDTGKLAVGSISFFQSLVSQALNQMLNDAELSDFGVYINPDQDILATSLLQIAVKLVPRGVARNIHVNMGFAVTTSF